MITNLFVLLLLGFALVANLQVRGESLLGSDLSSKEDDRSKLLTGEFRTLEDHLKGSDDDSPEWSVSLARGTLRRLGGGMFSGNKRFKKVLELFISLDGTKGKCNIEAYLILAKNYAAIEYIRPDDIGRVRAVLNHYQERHALECRPKYKELFGQQSRKVPEEDLQKIRRLFGGLQISMFDPSDYLSDRVRYQKWDLASMPTPRFTSEQLKPALDELVGQVIEQVKQSGLWKSLGTPIRDDHIMKAYRRVPDRVFDEYIFSPCKNYRDSLGDILTPARFDAMVEDQQQKDFLHGDKDFRDGLIYNRLCAGLLDERNRLTDTMVKVWAKLMKRF